MIYWFKYLIVTGLLLTAQLNAETWVRGAITLHEVSTAVELRELGLATKTFSSSQVPRTMGGLINCEAEYGATAYFSSSNRAFFFFAGDGSFAIERFEQIMPDPAAWEASELEPGRSRMILNFRAGNLIIDTRHLLEASQCLVETPLGRLSVQRALWQMQIAFDPRSQIFDFTITCSEGRVRYTDLQGQVYTLRAGQRLAGAGARDMPSIEVGERTRESIELLQNYMSMSERYAAAANQLSHYQSHFKLMEQSARQSVVMPAATVGATNRRPIVIEYADEPVAVTPFRGEVKAPASYQAESF
ncbi:hypothetical protein QEH59_04000 [Coraliomargarita sp. SDUM461004]|uniref:Uncharacterized protein n=1 Tax=Thalassobacterium sedimentorum TaxID=3041258 RepID=A0ABU1AFJ4_9BACT|nr:hypothetical protein [Coraliomargarita sp. SDUM461004]MDQ8193572.1 hypothetical protein [Coraliomargarita sp. SDUM461004]